MHDVIDEGILIRVRPRTESLGDSKCARVEDSVPCDIRKHHFGGVCGSSTRCSVLDGSCSSRVESGSCDFSSTNASHILSIDISAAAVARSGSPILVTEIPEVQMSAGV